MLGFSPLSDSTLADDGPESGEISSDNNNFAFLLRGPIGAHVLGSTRSFGSVVIGPPEPPPPPSIPVGEILIRESLTYIYDGKKFKLFSKKYNYKGSAPANISNTTELNLSTGNFFDVSLTEATTFTFANPPASGFAQKFQMKLTIIGTVNSITWPASVLWESGSAPTLPETGQTDILEFYTSDGGTTYYGKLKEDNVS